MMERIPSPPRPSGLQVQDVLRAHLDEYLDWRGERISHQEQKTLHFLDACRTPAMGQHAWLCTHCHSVRYDNNSCRNRHCPTCSGTTRRKWLARLSQRWLPTPCFHLVFTLPRELSRLGLANRAAVYELLFRASWESTAELLASRRQVQSGALAVLHT